MGVTQKAATGHCRNGVHTLTLWIRVFAELEQNQEKVFFKLSHQVTVGLVIYLSTHS